MNRKQIERNLNNYLAQFDCELKPGWRNLPFSERSLIANMSRNGITPADLQRERREGQQEAYQKTAPAVQSVCYAVMAIVLHDDFGFNKEECKAVLTAVDDLMLNTIDNEKIADELARKVGIRILTTEGVGRIVEADN